MPSIDAAGSPLADLHTHSTASDGLLSPSALVRLAHSSGVTALALTDHDTIAGLPEAQATANELGVDFLPGIEITAAFPRPGTMHLLAYGFDAAHPAFQRLLHQLTTARHHRVELILHRLNRAGIPLTLDQVLADVPIPNPELAPGSVPALTRPHLARALVKLGHATSTRDAFDRFLGSSGVAYADTAPLAAPDVIQHVRAAGGLVSLAHPLQLRRQSFAQLQALIHELATQGLEGLEILHSTHDTETAHKLARLADRESLLPTGGSDYHTPHRSTLPGQSPARPIPRSLYTDLVSHLRTRRELPALSAA